MIEALAGSDHRSFTALYEAYSHALFGAINRMLKNDALSEDALQNTFIKIWLHRDSYDVGKASLFTWMLNIARNEAIDALRSKQVKYSKVTISLNAYEPAPDRNPFFRFDHIDLHKQLFILQPRDRAILELCFFRGFTCQEVSRLLQLPCGTVKTRMQYSYKKLKTVLV